MTPEMEPMVPSDLAINQSALPDLAMNLMVKSAALAGSLSAVTASVIEQHMRVINSYYSNLIEGHSTHPRDIRSAMEGDYSEDSVKRDLQLESLAHIHVQNALSEGIGKPFWSHEYIKQVHYEFCAQLPSALLIVRSSSGRELDVIPGEFRKHDVSVGSHLAPPPEELERLLKRFFAVYDPSVLKGDRCLIGAMAAHHRFVWIHPFLDGNGRVVRLLTDAFMKEMGIGACGVWCLSRGLAKRNAEYKDRLARADYPRQSATDGRGALSEGNLVSFCEFMLQVAIDQVEYMAHILDVKGVIERIGIYVDDRSKGLVRGMPKLRKEAARLLERAFILGEFPRSEMVELTGLSLPTAKKLVQQMKQEGLLTEKTHRSPLRWAIPEHAERYYFPELI